MKRLIAIVLALCTIMIPVQTARAGYNPPDSGTYGGNVPYLSDLKLSSELIEKYAPDKAGALAIAKKYYDMCKPEIKGFSLSDFIVAVNWTPDFTGKYTDTKKATSLSMLAVLLQRQTNDAYFYTAFNAAVFALDAEGTAGALNFASAIATCGEDLADKKVKGIDRAEFNADALLMYCYALRICSKAQGAHVITALTGAAGILYDMGDKESAQKVYEKVVEMDVECCEAFDSLFNLYLETGQWVEAQLLLKKSPTKPMTVSYKKAVEEEAKEAKKLQELPVSPKTEADMEQIGKALEQMRNASIADYYDNIGANQAAMIAIRRHVEQMRGKMKGANPPDMQYVLQYGQYDAFMHYDGPGFESTMFPWEDRATELSYQVEAQFDSYIERMGNLAAILQNSDNYLNPNDMVLQALLVTRANNIMGWFAFNVIAIDDTNKQVAEMSRIAEQKLREISDRYQPEYDELDKQYRNATSEAQRKAIEKKYEDLSRRDNNEQHDYCKGVFGSAVEMAAPKYKKLREVLISTYTPAMINIMMVSDPVVQNYLLTKWDMTMTALTVAGIDMLRDAFNVAPFIEYRSGETQMLDPGTADREAYNAAKSNAEIARQKQAMADFYAGKIDENSQLYKRENENYGQKLNFLFVKVEMNDFITKTSSQIDLKCFEGKLNTVTNNIRGDTTYNGTVKVGLSESLGKVGTTEIKGSAGLSGSFTFTTDGKGGIVPDSLQGKVGLEASLEGGPLKVSVGAGVGTDGVYAEVKAEVGKLGGKVEVGLEVTTTKGSALSSGVSISNQGVKDWNPEWEKAVENTPGVEQLIKSANQEKVLWTGEYVIHTW